MHVFITTSWQSVFVSGDIFAWTWWYRVWVLCQWCHFCTVKLNSVKSFHSVFVTELYMNCVSLSTGMLKYRSIIYFLESSLYVVNAILLMLKLFTNCNMESCRGWSLMKCALLYLIHCAIWCVCILCRHGWSEILKEIQEPHIRYIGPSACVYACLYVSLLFKLFKNV